MTALGDNGRGRPPHLPADGPGCAVPQAIRDFVGCTAEEVLLAPGRIDWMGLPGGVRPDVRFAPGRRRGSVEMVVSLVGLGIVETKLTVEVRDGGLRVDTNGLPAVVPGLGDIRAAIAAWVQDLDDWLAHNDKALGDVRLRRGRMRLTKTERARGELSRPAGLRSSRRPPGSLAAVVRRSWRRASR